MTEMKPAVRAELLPHGGVPTIHVNGVPDPGIAYMTYWPKSGPLREFNQAGVHLYSVPSTCCQHLVEAMVPVCWLGGAFTNIAIWIVRSSRS